MSGCGERIYWSKMEGLTAEELIEFRLVPRQDSPSREPCDDMKQMSIETFLVKCNISGTYSDKFEQRGIKTFSDLEAVYSDNPVGVRTMLKDIFNNEMHEFWVKTKIEEFVTVLLN